MRKCYVYINNVEAGTLIETDSPRTYLFSYNKDYIQKGLPPVCLSMPTDKSEYRSRVLFPYFYNLLSEGENRVIQASMHHIDKDDDFGILLATAQYDTVGAVTVKPINQ